MRIWPFSKKKDTKDIKNTYTGEIDIEQAIKLISGELGVEYGIGGQSTAGRYVSEKTAMQFSAVYACVSLLSGTIASMSCEVFKSTMDKYEVAQKASKHPIYRLVHDQPNNSMSAYIFWETIGYECFLTGNSYAVIDRDWGGNPIGIYWVPSRSVDPFYAQDYSRILYRVFYNDTASPEGADRKSVVYDQDDVLHFPCIGWDGLRGRSPISVAKESIGLGLAGEEYNSRYFSNGITSDVAIMFKKQMSADAEKAFRESLQKRYGGGANNRIPLILRQDADVKSLRMNADDAQMMASRSFQIADICRFYGVPMHLVASTEKTTSWGSGIEEQTIGFVKFTIRRRVKMLEQEINRKLLGFSTKFFVKFNMDELLRGDTKTRSDYYKSALGGNQVPGYMAQNEARKMEGLSPIDNEKYDLPYRPVEQSGEETTTGDDNENNQPGSQPAGSQRQTGPYRQ